jgi:hypothetical protein
VIARRRSPEAAIQRAVIEHLRLRAKPDVLWLHVPNGGSRDMREAANLKRMGALAGASDLLLFRPGACPHCNSARLEGFALELKAPGGRPSEPQLDFMARFADTGGHTCIAPGLDRALAILEAWGLLRGRALVERSGGAS